MRIGKGKRVYAASFIGSLRALLFLRDLTNEEKLQRDCNTRELIGSLGIDQAVVFFPEHLSFLLSVLCTLSYRLLIKLPDLPFIFSTFFAGEGLVPRFSYLLVA